MRQHKVCKKCNLLLEISCLCNNEIKKDDGPRANVYNGVTDDRLYTKQFDRGAGRKWNSYAERKQWLDSKGWACE